MRDQTPAVVMDAMGKLMTDEPVRVLALHRGEYLVTDGVREWWEKKEFVRV